ncbi:MAG: radical SAM protein [Bryobacteraceae bacterium]|jgi:uncharacterized protein
MDTARIGVLDRGGRLLVMDRLTGRSVFLNSDHRDYLKLAATSPQQLPEPLRGLRRKVIGELEEHGLGTAEPRRLGDLNTIILKLTSACNYGCTYCYDYESDESAARLDLSAAMNAVSQALAIANPGLQVIFHGGEPFLVFDRILKIVTAAKQEAAFLGKEIVFQGQTNLSLLTEETVRASEAAGIHWGFSLDGPPDSNALRVLKNGQGTFERFETAYRRFPGFVRSCRAMATITSANHGKLLELSRFFQSYGLPGWDWSLFQAIGRGRALRVDIDRDVLIASWNELLDAVADGEFDGYAVSPVLKYLDNFILGPGRHMCLRRECGAARDLVSISANGQIEACDCIDPHGPLAHLGHLGSTTLEAARNSPTAERIRSRDITHGKCGSCIWLAVCGGTCLARSPGLGDVDDLECGVSLNAFDRISMDLAGPQRLLRYFNSCHESHARRRAND